MPLRSYGVNNIYVLLLLPSPHDMGIGLVVAQADVEQRSMLANEALLGTAHPPPDEGPSAPCSLAHQPHLQLLGANGRHRARAAHQREDAGHVGARLRIGRDAAIPGDGALAGVVGGEG